VRKGCHLPPPTAPCRASQSGDRKRRISYGGIAPPRGVRKTQGVGHCEVGVPTTQSLATRALRWAVSHPRALFAVFVVVAAGPGLGLKDLWFPDETRHAAVLVQLVDGGHWLALRLGEAFYADKPPIYFWFVAMLAWASGSTAPPVFLVAAALTGWLYLCALWDLSRTLGFSRRVGIVAGLILLSSWFFLERLHHPRMDLLFSAFMFWAMAAGISALRGTRPPGRAIWAGLAISAAVMTKGPLGLALPALGLGVAAWIWRKDIGTGVARNFAIGALAGLGLGALYLGGLVLAAGPETLQALLFDQTLQRAVAATSLSQPWHWYFLPLLAAALPWTPALLLWTRPDTRAARWVWGCALAWLIALSLPDYKAVHFLVPLLGPLALLLAWHLTQASPRNRRGLAGGLAGLMAIGAALAPFAPNWTLWPEAVRGAPWVALAAVGAAGLIWSMRRRGPVGLALALWGGVTLIGLPYTVLTLPGLNTVMSPAAAGALLAEAHAQGHETVEFHPSYRGIFDYHAGHIVTQAATPADLAATVAAAPCGVLVLRNRDLNARPDGDWSQVLTFRLDYARYEAWAWGGTACD
jgi:4-amino-4-deoxy-L-arabinose transferase-like glycosyltransferase